MNRNFNKNDPTYMAPSPIGRLLRIIGNDCYAYSGNGSFNDTARTLLDFHTGSEVIKGTWYPYRNDNDSLDSSHRIYFNDIIVQEMKLGSGGSNWGGKSPEVLIPPFTHVKATIINVSNTSNGNGAISFTGKVTRGDDPNRPFPVTEQLL